MVMEMDIGKDVGIDSVGAANDNVGVQLPTFFSLFFQTCAKFRKKPNLGDNGLVKFGPFLYYHFHIFEGSN